MIFKFRVNHVSINTDIYQSNIFDNLSKLKC